MSTEACQPIRDRIAETEEGIASLQDLIDRHEVPPSMKPTIDATLKREKQHLKHLKEALRACEQAGKTARG